MESKETTNLHPLYQGVLIGVLIGVIVGLSIPRSLFSITHTHTETTLCFLNSYLVSVSEQYILCAHQ